MPENSVCPTVLVTAHIAEVVMSDIFATANSLKSYARQHLLSPFSNNRAGTLKLCTNSRPPVFEDQAFSNSRTSFKSP